MPSQKMIATTHQEEGRSRDGRTSSRAGGSLAGVIFVILLLVVLLAFPAPPDFGGPDSTIARYYLDEQPSIQASNLVAAFAIFFLLWFLGGCGASSDALRLVAKQCRGRPSGRASWQQRPSSWR
jgi:hypothetical protein